MDDTDVFRRVVVNTGSATHPVVAHGYFVGLLRLGCDRCGPDEPYAVVRLDDDPDGLMFLWTGPVHLVKPEHMAQRDPFPGMIRTSHLDEKIEPPQPFNPDDNTRENL